MGAAGASAALLPTGRLDTAMSVAQATLPRSVRIGRDGFVARLCENLAQRDGVAFDLDALSLLDRIDVLILDARLLSETNPSSTLAIPLPALVAALRPTGVALRIAGPGASDVRVESVDEVSMDTRNLEQIVRDAQADGHVVSVAWSKPNPGLRAADLGIGIGSHGSRWDGHLLLGSDAGEVLTLADALGQARAVADESVKISSAGAGVAALFALSQISRSRMSMSPNVTAIASAFSLANGYRRANQATSRAPLVRPDPVPCAQPQ